MTLASFLAREFMRRNAADKFKNPALAAQNFFVGAATALDYVDTEKAEHIRQIAVDVQTYGLGLVESLARDPMARPFFPNGLT